MAGSRIIVEKYGSTSTTNERGMDGVRLNLYSRSVAEMQETYGIIIVSSGSIATGASIWHQMYPSRAQPDDQALATLGSGKAFTAWQDSLRDNGIPAGQLLISHRELRDPKEGEMFKRTLRSNLAAGIISICNENDAVSDVEVKAHTYGGDNDGLASHIAIAMDASYLVLRTDVRGLLDEEGDLVESVSGDNICEAYELAGYDGMTATNSMGSKVAAARDAALAGITTFICHADDSFDSLLDGSAGTLFVPA